MSDLGPLGFQGLHLLALDLGHPLQHLYVDLTHQCFGHVDPELCQGSDHLFGAGLHSEARQGVLDRSGLGTTRFNHIVDLLLAGGKSSEQPE
jgi:hypothetical protein